MQPLDNETKQGLLAKGDVTPEEIAEYETLLSRRFTIDPTTAQVPEIGVAGPEEQLNAIGFAETGDRLRELDRKLFGSPQDE